MSLAEGLLSIAAVLSLSLTWSDTSQNQSRSTDPNTVRVGELAAKLDAAASEAEQEQLLASGKDLISSALLAALKDRADARLKNAAYLRAVEAISACRPDRGKAWRSGSGRQCNV